MERGGRVAALGAPLSQVCDNAKVDMKRVGWENIRRVKAKRISVWRCDDIKKVFLNHSPLPYCALNVQSI